jgi:hypothetical protein
LTSRGKARNKARKAALQEHTAIAKGYGWFQHRGFVIALNRGEMPFFDTSVKICELNGNEVVVTHHWRYASSGVDAAKAAIEHYYTYGRWPEYE